MPTVFFTDRNLGQKFPDILRAAGINVERHADHFADNCPDEDWLRAIGERRWVAISHDQRIRYKPNELAAVMQHRVALLVVVGHAPYAQLAHAFVATHARILRFIEQHQPPYIAKIYRPPAIDAANEPKAPGRIELWHPTANARRY
jgi:hypothetical protein